MRMSADVGLASVLSQASYVNHLEHQGTFAYAGTLLQLPVKTPAMLHLGFIAFHGIFSSICITQMHGPVMADSRPYFQSLTKEICSAAPELLMGQ